MKTAMSRWRRIKARLAPYTKIVSTGYGAFAAIRQLQHPTVNLAEWMLWSGAVVTSLLFAVSVFERLPLITVTIYDAVKKN
jgi:hypothetical protein